MKIAPADETARQRALDGYHIVDTLPEGAYDDIVGLASAICDAPIALMTLLDRERQWFKASVGLEAAGTPRDVAFCNHAIQSPDRLMEVNDATQDARFVANPLVAGDEAIRFYAGMTLVTPNGHAIGTVCVLDRTPRVLDAEQRNALAALSRLAMNLLDGRERERTLERATVLGTPAANVATSAVAPGTGGMCTVAIVEVAALRAWAARIGERAVEKALQQMDEALHACLPATGGHVVNRVTGSAEFIAVLQGSDTDAVMQSLRGCLHALEREHDIRMLVGIADAHSGQERLDAVYMRAEAALSAEKDNASAARMAMLPADNMRGSTSAGAHARN